MSAYYNEWDKYAAQWLRNLIAAGHLPAGEVDERSITEVQADDLKGFTQCHFFAGIGGWPYALDLAGWPRDRPVWTGSCPCQPFSAAGKQSGAADHRHLWPDWFRLIRERRPDPIFGEQVEGAVGFGWLDRVFADLEAEGYACGATVLGAHSVGAPHIRQRLWWVADSHGSGERRGLGQESRAPREGQGEMEGSVGQRLRPVSSGSSEHGCLANAQCAEWGAVDSARANQRRECLSQRQEGPDRAGGRSAHGGLGNADNTGPQGHRRPVGIDDQEGRQEAQRRPWSAGIHIDCADGKSRRVEPGIFPLAHGVSARVGKLRAAGNAIVPQVAAEFIAAFMECRP